jgi:heme A synthase
VKPVRFFKEGTAMLENIPPTASITGWHRKLLTAAAVFIILLIAAGGVLCVTQSIRDCPDWPGCFGKLYPPLETSPILEYTHRVLAASSGALILAAAVTGVVKARRLGWILVPPLLAVALLVEVSYFGAMVVLKGITPGWAAVDVGSALLAAALMVTAAGLAQRGQPYGLSFRNPPAKLALAAVATVYVVLVSGVLVAGQNSITGCLGWPLYSPLQVQLDGHGVWNLLRLGVSGVGLGLITVLLVQARRKREERPGVYRMAKWVLLAVLVEAGLQALLLTAGLKEGLLVPYTITMAFLWGLLVALMVESANIAEFRF